MKSNSNSNSNSNKKKSKKRSLPTGIYAMPSGRFRVAVPQGRGGPTKYYNGFETVVDAEEFRAACVRANRRGEPHPPMQVEKGPQLAGKLTPMSSFRTVAEEWLKESGQQVMASSRRQWESRLSRRAYPALGAAPIGQISRQDVSTLLQPLAEVLSERELALTLWTINAVFEHALVNDLITTPPTFKMKPPRSNVKVAAKANRPIPTPTVRAVAKHFPPHARITIWLGLLAGLRIGEALGLRICDVDLEHHMLHLRNMGGGKYATLDGRDEWVRTREGLKGSKRGAQELRGRSIKIPPVLVAHLAEHLSLFRAEADPTATVVATRSGKVHWDSAIGEMLDRGLKRENVSAKQLGGSVSFHLLRKTISTRLGEDANVTAKARSRFLGHKMVDPDGGSQVTSRAYDLETDQQLTSVAESIERLIQDELEGNLGDFERQDRQHPANVIDRPARDIKDAPEDTQLVTATELAELVGCSRASAMKWLRDSHVPGYREPLTPNRCRWWAVSTPEIIESCRFYWHGPSNSVSAAHATKLLGVTQPRISALIDEGVLEATRPALPQGPANRRTFISVTSLAAELKKRSLPIPDEWQTQLDPQSS